DGPSGLSHLGSPRPDPRFLSTRRVPSEGLLYGRAGRASASPPTSLLLPLAPEREHQYGSSPGLSPATAPPVARNRPGDRGWPAHPPGRFLATGGAVAGEDRKS